MDDEKSFSHGKRKAGNFRKYSHSSSDNGKRKRQNSSHDHNFMTSKPIDTIYRILCLVEKIDSVLGKGGDIVNALREVTHAKIRVADAIPGAKERVIIIFSYLSQQYGELNSDKDPDDVNFTWNESEDMKPHCPAQDALLKVHDRIVADEVLRGGVVHQKTEADDIVTAHILVPSKQVKIPNSAVASVLGAGGRHISGICQISGARVKLHDPLSGASECVVEIHGSSDQMKAAQSLLDASTAPGGQNMPPAQARPWNQSSSFAIPAG